MNVLAWIGSIAILFAIGIWTGSEWSSRKYQTEIAEARLAFEKRIIASNKATEIDQKRIAAQLEQSEAEIDRLGKEYQDAVSKNAEAACVLSDFDLRSLWDDPRTPGAKPGVKRRLRPSARKASPS